ncbi:MAG: undecaprenyl-diphosphate phosphatase [Phycisphaerae bacterium]|nr:undecaprenyl-diphosphate phosphatase [Phycisphaerae bacterium]
MTELTFTHALILGVVQGLTEFLPVSSSAHLAITQRWMGLDPDSPGLLLFDVLAHLGTLAAVLIVFRRPIRLFLRAAISGNSTPDTPDRPRRSKIALRLLTLGIVASIPTAIIGLVFKDDLEAAFGKPSWIGGALLATAVLLALTAVAPRPRRGWRSFRGWQAGAVGVAQGVAILPGISRSGATICTALLLGLRPRWAAEFSFLIAVPAIAGASLIKFKDTVRLPAEELEALAWNPILLGAGVSFLVGLGALLLLLAVVRRAKLHYFAPYCFLLGLLILMGIL